MKERDHQTSNRRPCSLCISWRLIRKWD